ncbi:putative gram domain-containing protein [Zalerion maritima]|uniref:Gram domain-containing protein n=1 Tax=Zalerion maritima TaxID=339359 RepID=A0AAD5RJC9_9PEZI|nr:putative gram domain-containing protein [Zalerion maritima]
MESHNSSSNSLGKLLPKAITSRRRRKHSSSRDAPDPDIGLEDGQHQRPLSTSSTSQSHGTASDDALRATSIAHSSTNQPNTTFIASVSTSTGTGPGIPSDSQTSRSRSRTRRGSKMAADHEETTSLDSHGSDQDAVSRPHLISAHPSQIGYLTTSSPLVQDAHLKSGQPDSIPRSATFAADSPVSEIAIPRPSFSVTKTGLVPPQSSSSKRSPSPAGRFREVFRSKKASSTSSSPERSERRSEPQLEPDRRPTIPTSVPTVNVPEPSSTPEEPVSRPQTAPGPGRTRSQSKPSQTRIATSGRPPRTPPTSDHPAPVIVNTPPTPTDPIYPQTQHSPTKSFFASAPPTDGASTSSPSANATSSPRSAASTINARRTRAGSNASIGPSKLSNLTLPPLTPTPESGPGVSAAAASGFFTSMISAAQNAANSFSNTITTTNIGTAKGKPSSVNRDRETDIRESIEKPGEETPSQDDMSGQSSDQKELAINTLGQGSLSLSQLGLAENNSTTTTPATARFPESAEMRHRSDSAPIDPEYVHRHDSTTEEMFSLPRPISLYDSTAPGDRTPPAGSLYEGRPGTGIQRSGSIRSAIGGAKRRTRGGSTATGTTIGAAISAATASVGNPLGNASVPKLTGFAVASKKRNRDFHAFFKSVPDDDYLIEDYSCALQREILAHGRLYVSEGHLCFSSNIFGWVTTLVMSFDEIVSVEKRSTALVFKNGLMISTLHAKHVFASFTSRDSTYDLIVNIWKLGHPSLRSSLNGVRLDETGGDKTEKIDAEPAAEIDPPSGSESEEEESEGGEDVYDEDEDNDQTPDTTQVADPMAAVGDPEKTASRKVSGPALSTAGGADKSKEAAAASTTDTDFPGPPTHAPTDCGDADTHYDKSMGEDVIPAPLGKVYNMMFGPPTWMSKFITTDQKCTELQMDDKALTLENKTRDYSFIKPLNGPIGPKQTKCIANEVLDNLDFNKSVNVTVTTQTPDVPSGNVFNVKTRYCLSWAENNQTRIQMTCTIEWTGKSWLKGPIEKGTIDGQSQYAKELFACLKAGVTSRSRTGTLTNGAPAKPGKKRGKKSRQPQPISPTAVLATTKSNAKQSWGVFEPVEPFLGPIVDIIKPILTGNVVYGLLVGLLVATWFGFGFPNRPASGIGRPYGANDLLDYRYYPDRIVAYEEMWRREESELWDWLEERVGLRRLGNEGEPVGIRKRAIDPRTVEERLREDRMNEREVNEAIRVTEEKLKVLKEVVEKRKLVNEEKPVE